MKKKRVGADGIRVRVYPLLAQIVEEGVAHGWRRAYKHTDNPGEVVVQNAIVEAVMTGFSEAFIFDDTEGS